MRERLVERCVMDAAPTRGLRRGAGIPQRNRWSRALAQRREWGWRCPHLHTGEWAVESCGAR
eukprot:1176838-Prymnesium_polylepis.1